MFGHALGVQTRAQRTPQAPVRFSASIEDIARAANPAVVQISVAGRAVRELSVGVRKSQTVALAHPVMPWGKLRRSLDPACSPICATSRARTTSSDAKQTIRVVRGALVRRKRFIIIYCEQKVAGAAGVGHRLDTESPF
jgi:hypothetical protein